MAKTQAYIQIQKRKKQEEFIKILQEDGLKLKEAPEECKKDRELVLLAVRENGSALQYADESLQQDKELLFIVKTGGVVLSIAELPDFLKENKQWILQVVNYNGRELKNVPDKFKKDWDVALVAVKENGGSLEYVDQSLLYEKEILFTAIKWGSGIALEYMPEILKKNKLFILEIMKINGLALEYVGKDFQSDPEVVVEAIKQNPKAVEFALAAVFFAIDKVIAKFCSDYASYKKITDNIKELKQIWRSLVVSFGKKELPDAVFYEQAGILLMNVQKMINGQKWFGGALSEQSPLEKELITIQQTLKKLQQEEKKYSSEPIDSKKIKQ